MLSEFVFKLIFLALFPARRKKGNRQLRLWTERLHSAQKEARQIGTNLNPFPERFVFPKSLSKICREASATLTSVYGG